MKYFTLSVTHRYWHTEHVFELRFQRPETFGAVPGQKVRIACDELTRDYSLMNTSLDDHLAICVRHIPQGALSPVLAQAEVGQMFDISEAFGYFTYQPSEQMPVFVATGTGIAPFVAYARSGVSRYCLLHGVRSADELYYREKVEPPAVSYIPCVSELPPNHATDGRVFAGRVTRYLQKQLPPGVYDFYLCGRGEMVRDAMEIIDQRFEGSRVFTEVFF